MTYNTEGIILKYRDIGEFDRIYSILTFDHGKVDGWAQGIRKPQSKLVSHLQPLYLCDLMIARGRRFDRIAQVSVKNRFAELWEDLEKLSKATYVAALVDLVLRPGTKEHAIYGLFLETLELFKSGDGALEVLFSLKLLKESGFLPELRHCVLCKEKVEGLSRHFDAIRGGVLCQDCFIKAGPAAFSVSSLTLDTLGDILDSELSRLEMPEQIRRELTTVSDRMVEAHFGELPRSRAFIDFLAKQPLAMGVGV